MIKIEITIPMLLDEKQSELLKETAHYLLAMVSESSLNRSAVAKNTDAISQKLGEILVYKMTDAEIEGDESDFKKRRSLESKLLDESRNHPFADQEVALPSNQNLDSHGSIWDPKIHSKTQSKNADGTWKFKRGYQPSGVVVMTPISPPIITSHGIPLPPMNPSQPDAIPAPPITIDNFPDFMVNITDLIAAGKLNRAQLLEAVKSVGLESVPVVATRPDLIPAINAAINKMAGL